MNNKTPTLFDDFFAEEDNNPARKAEPGKKRKNTKEKAEDTSSLSLFLEPKNEDEQQAETVQTEATEDITDRLSPENVPLDKVPGNEAEANVSSLPESEIEHFTEPGIPEEERDQAESTLAGSSADRNLPGEATQEIPGIDHENHSLTQNTALTSSSSPERNNEEMNILDQNIRTELPYRFSFDMEAPPPEPGDIILPKKKSAIVFENAPPPPEKKADQPGTPPQEKGPEEEGILAPEADEHTLSAPGAIELPQWNLDKKYYTISTVAKMFDVNISHIRFWTNEFNLKPRTNKKGDRLYTPELIETLRLIHHLVKVQHHTIKGAKAKLKTKKATVDAGITLKENLVQLKETLLELRNQIN